MCSLLITQHVPGFCRSESDGPPRAEHFETLDELRSISWVKQFEREMNGMPFFRWSKSNSALMVEHGDGKGEHWWVVGFLSDPDKVDLPLWERPSV